jgi:hypothetical protein
LVFGNGWGVLEGADFRYRDRNLNFESKSVGKELVTGVEEAISGSGARKFWGIYAGEWSVACGSKQRTGI